MLGLKKSQFSRHRTKENAGYTLVELLITISIIAILVRVMLPVFDMVRDDAHFARSKAELKSIHESLMLYREKYGDFPADTNRSIPPGLEEFLAPGIWPDASWPGGVFDWENWEDPDDSSKRILQISIRFCPIGKPDECRFPDQSWAEYFDINSSVYYCVKGACRAHIDRPIDHPGYCVNCNP